MIAIIVEGGCVQAVYSDQSLDEIKVLDLDNAEADGTSEQLHREIAQVERQLHQVL